MKIASELKKNSLTPIFQLLLKSKMMNHLKIHGKEDNPAYKKLIISFRTKEDYDEFVEKTAKILDQTMTQKTKTIWYPALSRDENSLKRWIEE
jgi:23S rRNA A2030 N6-methylase RlmJ